MKEYINNLPTGFTLGSLRPEHAELILQHLEYYHRLTAEELAGMFEEVKYTIFRIISACIFNNKGEPVSWVLHKIDGSVGMSHTLHEYRNLGLYTIAQAAFIKGLSQSCFDIYGFTAITNDETMHLARGRFAAILKEEVDIVEYQPAKSHL